MAGSPLKKARRLAAATPIDPLDEAPPRPSLAHIPWNKVELTAEQRDTVATALSSGYTRTEIAAALDVSTHTLRRLIRDTAALGEAIEAAEEAELEEIRSLLMTHGRAGDTVALIFLGKAFHGLRDRDDSKGKEAPTGGGVLVVPGVVPLGEWSLAAVKQQAPYRERPEIEPIGGFRSFSIGVDGLRLERTELGDLPT